MVLLAFMAGVFVGVAIGVVLAAVLSMLREKQVPDDLMSCRDDKVVPASSHTDSHKEVA